MPVDARDVDLAARPAHDEHLGAAGAVDLDDAAELLAVRAADLEALELAPQPAAGLAGLVGLVDLEVHAPQRIGGRAVGGLAEAQPPAGPVGDGGRLDDGQRARGPLAVERGAHGEALLRACP